MSKKFKLGQATAGTLKLAIAVAAMAAVAGCTTSISKGINDQGKAQEVVFPDPVKDPKQPEGSYPNREWIQNMRLGMTKAQVYGLIGVPHYSEGYGAREWDYLFHLPPSLLTCQYKVIFDKDMLVGTMAWFPEKCDEIAAAPTKPR